MRERVRFRRSFVLVLPGFSVTAPWAFNWFLDGNENKVDISIVGTNGENFLLNAHGVLRRMGAVTEIPGTDRRITPDICIPGWSAKVKIYVLLREIVLLLCSFCRAFATRAMASDRPPDMDQAGPSYAPSAPLAGTFFGPTLDLTSEKLYDLAPDIPDVMGLRALRPSAAVVKVMSVPDSRCICVVTPDDHVNIGFHEILLHDMGEEELPFVATSEFEYLRRIWLRALFVFMSRYQQDLELMRKECKEQFGCTQSGNCTHCGKYIQRDLGKHIAFYHIELAQLWRCPVMWCTVWKGTAQDCIDHMWRVHKVPPSVKAANLARYFPPWTVNREQWADMMMPSISGVAIDTLLFSRIGSPLCHRYRIISWTGSHAAFRGTYLHWLRVFLEESDSAVVCRLHRQLAQELAARIALPTDNPASVPSRSVD